MINAVSYLTYSIHPPVAHTYTRVQTPARVQRAELSHDGLRPGFRRALAPRSSENSEALQILRPSWPVSIFTRVFVVIKRLSEARLISTVPVSALILSFAPAAAGNDKGTVSAACEWSEALTSNRAASSCQYFKPLLGQHLLFHLRVGDGDVALSLCVTQWSAVLP